MLAMVSTAAGTTLYVPGDYSRSPTVTTCTFSGNVANDSGGGVNGGFSIAAGGGGVGAGAISVGGSGDTGGNSKSVTVTSSGAIDTSGDEAIGLFAQSVGGGGGNGGFSISGAGAGTGAGTISLEGSGLAGAIVLCRKRLLKNSEETFCSRKEHYHENIT